MSIVYGIFVFVFTLIVSPGRPECFAHVYLSFRFPQNLHFNGYILYTKIEVSESKGHTIVYSFTCNGRAWTISITSADPPCPESTQCRLKGIKGDQWGLIKSK